MALRQLAVVAFGGTLAYLLLQRMPPPRARRARPVSDETLAARVRIALWRTTSNPEAIRFRAQRGTVTLAGRIPASEHERMLRIMRHVPGVERLIDRLRPERLHSDLREELTH
jgi:hypothetical protein